MYYTIVISVCIHEVFYNPWRLTQAFPSKQYCINSACQGIQKNILQTLCS